jgi:hypothetical protein
VYVYFWGRKDEEMKFHSLYFWKRKEMYILKEGLLRYQDSDGNYTVVQLTILRFPAVRGAGNIYTGMRVIDGEGGREGLSGVVCMSMSMDVCFCVVFGLRYMHVVWVVRALHVFRFAVFISLVLVFAWGEEIWNGKEYRGGREDGGKDMVHVIDCCYLFPLPSFRVFSPRFPYLPLGSPQSFSCPALASPNIISPLLNISSLPSFISIYTPLLSVSCHIPTPYIHQSQPTPISKNTTKTNTSSYTTVRSRTPLNVQHRHR